MDPRFLFYLMLMIVSIGIQMNILVIVSTDIQIKILENGFLIPWERYSM